MKYLPSSIEWYKCVRYIKSEFMNISMNLFTVIIVKLLVRRPRLETTCNVSFTEEIWLQLRSQFEIMFSRNFLHFCKYTMSLLSFLWRNSRVYMQLNMTEPCKSWYFVSDNIAITISKYWIYSATRINCLRI